MFCLMDDKTVIHVLGHKLEVWVRAKGPDFEFFHKQVGNGGLMGESMAAP